MRLRLGPAAALLIAAPAWGAGALPGRLDHAVIALGRQARVSIGISEPGLALIRVRPVAAGGDVSAALGQMLAGTAATAVRVGPSRWRIVPRPLPLYPRPAPRVRTPPPPPPPPPEAPAAEIVVTASKRDTLLADYPASVSRLDQDNQMPGLEGQGSEALTSRIPSVTSTHLGPGRNKLFVRGLADSSFNGTTQATVGEYLGEARLNYNGPDPDLRLYDLRAVEVLEGPQGTLHGVGTLGGVIRFQPAPPDLARAGGSIDLGFSATEHGDPGADASGVLNLPLSSTLGLRAVGYRIREGGYIDDRLRGLSDVNRVDIAGGRAWLRFEPDSSWTIDLSGALQDIDGRDSQYADRDGPPLTKSSPIAEGFGSRYALASLALRKSWSSGLTLSSATSFARQRLHESFDASQPDRPSRFDQHVAVDFFSNENRLSGESRDGSGWVVGTSLVHNHYALERSFAPIAFFARLGGVANTVDEATLFGEGTIRIADGLRASAGGRLTLLQQSGEAVDAVSFLLARDAANKADRRQVALLPSLSLAWQPNRRLLVYGRYQQSFRPGGIVVRDVSVARYRPDDVKSAEIGFRYGGSGALLHLASSLAFTRWRNIQADQIDGEGLPTTVNIGNGRIVTLDIKASLHPAAGLSLDLAGVIADSRLTRPALATLAAFGAKAADVARSDLPNVARLNASGGLRYVTSIGEVDLSASAWARYVGRSRLGVGPVLGRRQGDYLDTGLALRATAGRYAATLTVTNLLGEVGNRFALGSPFMLGQEAQMTPLRPRTARLGLEVAF